VAYAAEGDPANHRRALQCDKLRCAHKGPDPVENAMMNSELLFVLPFKAQDGVDIP
jgi:hypothetical protein